MSKRKINTRLRLTAIKNIMPKVVGMYCVDEKGTKSPYQGSLITPSIPPNSSIMVTKDADGNYFQNRSKQTFIGNSIKKTCFYKVVFPKSEEGISYTIEETSNYYDEDTMVESDFLGFEEIKESKNYMPVIIALLIGLVAGYFVSQKYGKLI